MDEEEYTELFYEIESAKNLEDIKKIMFKLLHKVDDALEKSNKK